MNAFHIIASVMYGNTKVVSLAGHCCCLRVSFHSSCTWWYSLGLQLSWSAVTFASLDSFPCSVVSSELLQTFCLMIASGFASARVRSPVASVSVVVVCTGQNVPIQLYVLGQMSQQRTVPT